MSTPIVLSIAGFDPSSGAGISADVKTAVAHKCYMVACPTALTVQTTRGVLQVETVSPELVRRTLESLVEDLPPSAVRIGMLGSGSVATVVADFLKACHLPNVVLDPVLRSSSGATLLDDEGEIVLRERLLQMAHVVTPNLAEAAALCGEAFLKPSGRDDMLRYATALHRLGAKAVVVKGGHLEGEASDLLSLDGETHWFAAPQIVSRSTHGTGCAFAASIACQLAHGIALRTAVAEAKAYVRRAIERAEPLGRGHGPMKLI